MKFFQFISSLFLLNFASEKSWNPQNFPDPTKDFKACRRHAPSNLCDPDGILSNRTAMGVDKALVRLRHSKVVSCSGKKVGVEIGIALVERMDSKTSAERLAKSLHDQWGVGLAGCNTGIMMFLSKDDRRMYISTGSGVKGIVTDAQTKLVQEEMHPLLRDKEYGAAIFKGVLELVRILKGHKKKRKKENFKETEDESPIVLFVFIFAYVALLGYMYYDKRKLSGIRRDAECQVTRIQRETETQRRDRRFSQDSCPDCLREFDPPAIEIAFGFSMKRSPLHGEILKCGHKYCTQCLAEWENLCPICHAVIKEFWMTDFMDDMAIDLLIDRLMDEDRDFRLASLHKKFPKFVTPDMIFEIKNGMYDSKSWTDHKTFEAEKKSDDISFGGGSSAGGGGSGSSW